MNDPISLRPVRVNFQWYLAFAASWALSQERLILKKGIPLTTAQLNDARLAGVAYPHRVRLLVAEQIPLPAQPELRAMVEAMKLNAPTAAGLSLRYGIYVRSEYLGSRQALVHKLAHTAQYERLGGVRTFLEAYLYQCLAVGKIAAPLEQEATEVAERICGPAPDIPTAPWPAGRAGKLPVPSGTSG